MTESITTFISSVKTRGDTRKNRGGGFRVKILTSLKLNLIAKGRDRDAYIDFISLNMDTEVTVYSTGNIYFRKYNGALNKCKRYAPHICWPNLPERILENFQQPWMILQ